MKQDDLPQGNAAPVPSPVFQRHAARSLQGPRDVAPVAAAAPAAASTPQAAAAPAAKPAVPKAPAAAKAAPVKPDAPSKPDTPVVPPRATQAELAHLSPEEVKAVRAEENRIKRVVEGRAPPRPGDPVPNAPLTVKEQKVVKGKGGKKKDFSDVHVAPVAPAARMRRRHWGVLVSLVLMVAVPLALMGWYLSQRAVDQYGSTVGFTVRSEEGGSAALTGILSSFGGGSTQTDTDILYEFIQSQGLVDNIQARMDLRTHYSTHYDRDPIYGLDPDATVEDLLSYWSQIVSVSYDQSSKLIEMRVQAFDPDMAQKVARAILDESQSLINALNATARADTLRYAEQDLAEAQDRLRNTREALILFRTENQIVDPEVDLLGRLGVVTSLQQQLAEALIEQDLLREQTSSTDPRYVQVRRKIEVIRERISEEKESVSSGDASSVDGKTYPQLLAEYEGLQADRLFSEETYRAAQVGYAASTANASRQSRYLATYIPPTLPQTAEYPRRWMTFGLGALFLMLIWSVVVLIYYSIRDSK